MKTQTGQIFGRLTVVKFAGKDRSGGKLWNCICVCGNPKIVADRSLTRNMTKSCGCLAKENGTKQGNRSKGVPKLSLRLPSGQATRNAILGDYKSSAIKRGLKWDIKDQEAFDIFKQNCYVCGIVPSQVRRHGHSFGDFTYTGIDRIDNKLGYTSNNVRPTCKRCNVAKNDMTEEEFVSWLKRIVDNRSTR